MPSDGGRAPSSCWCTARPARACARAQPPGRAPQCRERRVIAQQESRRQSFEQQGAERSLGAWASARVSVATLPPRRLSPSAPPRTARRRRLREPSPLCGAPRCRFAFGFAAAGWKKRTKSGKEEEEEVISYLLTYLLACKPLFRLSRWSPRQSQSCYPSSMACFSSSPSSSVCSRPSASRQSAARTTLRGSAGGRAFHPYAPKRTTFSRPPAHCTQYEASSA